MDGSLQVTDGCAASDAVMDVFGAISVVTGNAELSDNDAVTDMQGYGGLVDIGGSLLIERNSGLTSLAGLNSAGLTIGGDLIIRHNSGLADIAALNGVTVQGKREREWLCSCRCRLVSSCCALTY